MSLTLDPREIKVTKRQAQHLSTLTRIEPTKLVGKHYAELEELLNQIYGRRPLARSISIVDAP
jgi:hypothetical protein